MRRPAIGRAASYSSLQIAGGPTGREMDVQLNGEPIPGLKEITLYIATEDVTEVSLTIEVDRVEVDAETMVALQALADAKE